MMKRWSFALLSIMLILSIVLVACGPDEEEATVTPEAAEETTEEVHEEETTEEMVEVDYAVAPGGYLDRALHGEFAGTTVVVDGPLTDADEIKFKE